MAGSADWDRAKSLYPSTTKLTESDWLDFFTDNPDIVHKILGDIYVITKADAATQKKSGRRPRHINGNLDELWKMITPRYATEPFGPAVQELIGTQSIRQFSGKIPMHYWSLIRLMRGERQIVNPYDIESSMKTLELVAKAGKVHPTYFSEYRQLYIFSMFRDLFAQNPNFTIGVVQRLKKANA